VKRKKTGGKAFPESLISARRLELMRPKLMELLPYAVSNDSSNLVVYAPTLV
jgi:hypothetical protein